MLLKELEAIGKAKQSPKYSNMWMARHDGNKVTALNTETGAHVTVDMDDGLDAQAELETFFAEQGIGKEEREQRQAYIASRLGRPSTTEDGIAEHDVEASADGTISDSALFAGDQIPHPKGGRT